MLPGNCHLSLLRGSKRWHPCRWAKNGRQRFGGEGSCCTKMQKKAAGVRLLELWYHRDSNLGHTDFQSVALPTELWYPKEVRKYTALLPQQLRRPGGKSPLGDDGRLRANPSMQRYLQSLSLHSCIFRYRPGDFLRRVYTSSSPCDLSGGKG